MENKIIKELLLLSKRAASRNEVPVSAIITCNNKIIAKTYNKREKDNNVISHAEILCIQKASKKLKTWKLSNCVMYVTLKPCPMCECVIKNARIKNVYYLLEKPLEKKQYNKTEFIKISNKQTIIYKNELQKFFQKKRNNNVSRET